MNLKLTSLAAAIATVFVLSSCNDSTQSSTPAVVDQPAAATEPAAASTSPEPLASGIDRSGFDE
ncbi:MAG TPA: hypothetical protein VJN01_08975, partial [Xanthomonadales bacterium]|nr:hypothetical protein [Xanthomonadales bacterium]